MLKCDDVDNTKPEETPKSSVGSVAAGSNEKDDPETSHMPPNENENENAGTNVLDLDNDGGIGSR